MRPGDRVLDACCGTGDLALASLRAGAGGVVGLDFSPRMIERARRKSNAVAWVRGRLLSLPFEDEAFDAATVGFGVRNVADLDARAAASWRACSLAGGRLGILEITQPTGALAPFYRVWFERVVPRARQAAGRRLRVRVSARAACADFPARTTSRR